MPYSIFAVRGALLALFSLTSLTASAGGPVPVAGCRTLDTPGAFVVTAPIAVASGDCFVVAADFVNLDLGGFTVESASATGDAVTDLGVAHEGTVVRNGTIRRFGRALALAESTLAVAEDLILDGQGGGHTLEIGGDCRVERVHLTAISGKGTFQGIVTGDQCIVVHNTIDAGTTRIGITNATSGSGSIVSGNVVSEGGPPGNEDGINVLGSEAVLIEANEVRGPADLGIQSGHSSLITGNTIEGVLGSTICISTESPVLTTANLVSSCKIGIFTDGMSYVSQNNIEGTTDHGTVETGQGSRHSNNTLVRTGDDGMFFNNTHSIADNNLITDDKFFATNCGSGPSRSAIRGNQARSITGTPPFDSCIDLGGNVVLP